MMSYSKKQFRSEEHTSELQSRVDISYAVFCLKNMHWLSNEFNNSSASWFVGVSPVPPWNEDFDQSMVNDDVNLLTSKPVFIMSFLFHLMGPHPTYIRYHNNGSIP